MASFTVELAGAADIATITALERDYYGAEGYPSALFYQALVQWPQGLWVVKQQQQVQGYLLMAPSAEPKVLWLMSMLIAPAARGQGLGTLLLQQVIAQQPGLTCLRLTVAADNHAAQHIYRQCGFVKRDEIADFFGPGGDRWLYEWQR